YRLLISHIVSDAKELLLVQQHFFTPPTTNRTGSRQFSALTQTIVARSARTAEGLHICRKTVGSMLQDNAITNVQQLYIVTLLDHLPHHLVTQIHRAMPWQGRGRNANITIRVNKMQIATTNAR